MRLAFHLAILATCLLTPAIAAADDSGWYVGYSGAQTHASQASYFKGFFPRGIVPSDPSVSSSLDSSGKRLEGGYWFTPNIGVQAAITDLGRFSFKATYDSGGFVGCVGAQCGPATITDSRIEPTAETLALTGRWALSDEFDLIGRAGVLWGSTTYEDQSIGVPNGHPRIIEASRGGTLGVSLGWNFTDHSELLLGWDEYTGLGGNRFASFNVSAVSIGLQYHF
ncbi:MAG TPA: outer membrane beta-barrel protein [Gammaproteobacteria bacterium]